MRAAVVIETMHEADVAAALDVDVASFPASQLGAEAVDVQAVREAQLRDELVRPWARLRVARGDGGVLLGYSLFWHVADEVHLLNVAVAPAERRKGIGRALVLDVLAYVTANAVSKVLLEARAGNVAALGLYEALGFVRLGVRTRYYADGEDAIEMIRTT